MSVRLVAIDLDGTVLREDGIASRRTIEALRAAIGAGITVVICTARSPRFTFPVAEQLELHDGFAVANSGGTVLDLATGAVVHQHHFDPSHARTLVTRMRARLPGVAFSGYVGETWHREPHYISGLAADPGPEVADALEFLALGATTKVAIRHQEVPADVLHQHVAEAVAELGLSHALSRAGFVEVLGPGIDKAAGVAWVAETHGITAEQTIAFGDDLPDLPMLAWAGHGVAVGNAHPELIAIADEVCGLCDEDGVAEVLERILAARSAGGGEVSSSADRR